MIDQANSNHNRFSVAILIPDKMDFKTRNISRDTHFIMIRWLTHQEDKIIITKHHKLGGLKQRKFMSQFWWLEVQDQCVDRTKLSETCRGESFLDSS